MRDVKDHDDLLVRHHRVENPVAPRDPRRVESFELAVNFLPREGSAAIRTMTRSAR